MSAAKVFERLGGELIDPPVVMPAALPLELSGEAVRARLCVFPGEDGEECALRPDLTLPVAEVEVAARRESDGERIRRYNARAFRLPAQRGDPLEFTQVGFERYGFSSGADADASVFVTVCEAAIASGVPQGDAHLGDLAIFPAFVDALEIQPGMAEALKRAFRQAGGVHALLEMKPREASHGLAARLKGASPGEAEAIVRDIFALSGIQPVGLRSLDEIVTRLLEQAEDAQSGGVSDMARQTLEAVLGVSTHPGHAADALRAIARQAGLQSVDPVIDRLEARFSAMAERQPNFMTSARFSVPFGRRFNYYDGFVFELFEPGARTFLHPFGAGGRYDTLLERLSSGEVSATAIGGMVRPDRLETAARKSS